jgi:1-deoxyxylulose-5-phosphate synthase
MNYVNLGKSPLFVSKLCFGTMSFGYVNNQEESERLVKHALNLGVNFFDTAAAYTGGKSEEHLGKAVKGVRDQVVIATKFGCRQEIGNGINDKNSSRYHIMNAVETSLKRLGTDRIDLYMMHMPHEGMKLEETLRTLDDLVRQGKVLYIGCSNFPAWLLCKSLWISDVKNLISFGMVQSVYNLIERGIEMEVLPLCKAEGIGVMAYRGLCRGILAGSYLGSGLAEADKSAEELMQKCKAGLIELKKFSKLKGITMAQAAIAWSVSNPAITCPIVGATKEKELDELASAVDLQLTPEEWTHLSDAFGTEMKENQIGVHAPWRTNYKLLL